MDRIFSFPIHIIPYLERKAFVNMVMSNQHDMGWKIGRRLVLQFSITPIDF